MFEWCRVGLFLQRGVATFCLRVSGSQAERGVAGQEGTPKCYPFVRVSCCNYPAWPPAHQGAARPAVCGLAASRVARPDRQ